MFSSSFVNTSGIFVSKLEPDVQLCAHAHFSSSTKKGDIDSCGSYLLGIIRQVFQIERGRKSVACLKQNLLSKESFLAGFRLFC